MPPIPPHVRASIQKYSLQTLKPLLSKPPDFMGWKWAGPTLRLYLEPTFHLTLKNAGTSKALGQVCSQFAVRHIAHGQFAVRILRPTRLQLEDTQWLGQLSKN